jgi:hypothetical protein
MSSTSGPSGALLISDPMKLISNPPRFTKLFNNINYPQKAALQSLLAKSIDSYTTTAQVTADIKLLEAIVKPTPATDASRKVMPIGNVYRCKASTRAPFVTVQVTDHLVGNRVKTVTPTGLAGEYLGTLCTPFVASATNPMPVFATQMGGQTVYPTPVTYSSGVRSLASFLGDVGRIDATINPSVFETAIGANKQLRDAQQNLINTINDRVEDLKKAEIARITKIIDDIQKIIAIHEADKLKLGESYGTFKTAMDELKTMHEAAKVRLEELYAKLDELTEKEAQEQYGGVRRRFRGVGGSRRRRASSRRVKKRGTRKH